MTREWTLVATRASAVAAVALGALAAIGGCKKGDDLLTSGMKHCAPGECLETPTGLKGVSLGMTRGDAEVALGTLREYEARPIKPSLPGTFAELDAASVPSPGSSYAAGTTFGDLPATCYLHFVVDDKLSRISCHIDGGNSKQEAFKVVLSRLLSTYGKPGREDRQTARWSNGTVALDIDKRPADLHAQFFRLESSLLSDAAERARAVTAANARLVTARRLKKEREQAEKQALERKLRDGDDALDRDLGGAAERPAPTP